MKSYNKTLVTAAIVLGLAAYAYFVEFQGAEKEKASKEESEKLVKLEKDQIQKIEIVKGDRKVRVEKTDGRWKVVEPISDAADSTVVEQFLSSLSFEKSKELVEEGDNIDWKTFGLDAPVGKLVLSSADKSETFHVGSVKSYDSNDYLRLGDSNRVLLVASSWDTHVSKLADEFRDKRLLRVDQLPLYDSIDLEVREKGKTQRLVLKKQEGIWRPEGSKDLFPIASEKVASFLESVRNFKVTDFLPVEEAKSKAKAFGLDQPEIFIRLREGANAPFELKVSPAAKVNESKVFVTGNQFDAVGSVFKTSTDSLRKTLNDFLDKKVPFQFEASQAKKMLIEIGSELHEWELKDGKWSLARTTAKEKTPDLEKVSDLVGRLAKVEASEILEPIKKGSTPFRVAGRAELTNDKGESLLLIRWADMADKKVKVLTNKTERMVTVSEVSWSTLPFDKVMVAKAEPAPKPESKSKEEPEK